MSFVERVIGDLYQRMKITRKENRSVNKLHNKFFDRLTWMYQRITIHPIPLLCADLINLVITPKSHVCCTMVKRQLLVCNDYIEWR